MLVRFRPRCGTGGRRRTGRSAGSTFGFTTLGRVLLAPALIACLASASGAQSEPIDTKDRDAPLDIDIDDRVDPVRPGEEIVYEIEIENFTSQVAPDVVVTDTLPPGTSFVVAHREPDWAEVPAQVFADRIELPLGGVDPCDRPGVPRCRDIWLTLRVDPGVHPGTRLENAVAVESSDSTTYPRTEADTITAVGSAAIRHAVLRVGRPGRDRAVVDADLARTGLRTRLDPPTPNLDLSAGLTVRLALPGGSTLVDLTVPASALRCSNPSADPNRFTNCTVRDRQLLASAGVQHLQLTLRALLPVQRNNARIRLRAQRLTAPPDESAQLELTLEAGSETYTDTVPLAAVGGGGTRSYTRSQGEP